MTSTIKAKYIVLGHAAKKTVWIGRLINKMKLEVVEGIHLYGHNEMSIAPNQKCKELALNKTH